jgi:hypothetical protein
VFNSFLSVETFAFGLLVPDAHRVHLRGHLCAQLHSRSTRRENSTC